MVEIEFVPLEFLKKDLIITNDANNDKLQEIANDANHEVSKKIKPYAETTPLSPGDEFWEDAVHAAISFARMLWYEFTNQLEKLKSNKEIYDTKIESLIESLKKEPTSRTDPIEIMRTDFEGERKIPFSQIGYGGSEDALL